MVKLEEAIQLFDLVDDLVDTTDAIGIPTCCNLPVVQNSQDGVSRISCLECGREIREVGRQWVVSDWGRKGISFLRLSAALTVEAAREMARSSVPDNLEKAVAPASLGGDERRRFDQIESCAMARAGWLRFCMPLPGESRDSIPTWGDLLALARSQRELEGEVERLRSCLRNLLGAWVELMSYWSGEDPGVITDFDAIQEVIAARAALSEKPEGPTPASTEVPDPTEVPQVQPENLP